MKMGHSGRQVPECRMTTMTSSTAQSHFAHGLVPASPQKSPPPAFAAGRRPGQVQLPTFPTSPSNCPTTEEGIYYELDDSSSTSDCSASPEMMRRPLPSANHNQQQQHNQHHRKVVRSQSEPKAPNVLVEFNTPSGAREQLQPQQQNRFKTELCRSFQEQGSCKYGEKCQFAHGQHELRNVARHAKYKTERCVNFHATGLCAYGRRCHFIHHPEEENQPRRPSVCIPENTISHSKVAARNSPTGSGPVRSRAVSLSSFPPPITIPSSSSSMHQQQHNFIADQSSLHLGSCGNSSRSALSSCSYSSSPLSMSPGISAWHDRDPFGSSSSSEVFQVSDEESNCEAPGPWARALSSFLSDIDY